MDATHSSAVEIANNLLERFGITKEIKCITDCNDEYFLILYEAITGEVPFGVVKNPDGKEDRIRNCQLIIDSLSSEILETDLSHIEAKNIVDSNVVAIANLLEIFMGLLEYIFEELQKEGDDELQKEEQSDEGDSNLLPGDHEVLSEVFQDAFGPSYVESMEDQKIMLRKSKERESSQYIAEGYTIPNGAPSQHTDTESLSSHDFTQDSLYDQGDKTASKEVDSVESVQKTLEIHPFAYVSSSASSTTEHLIDEAENLQKKEKRKKSADLKSASTTKLHKVARGEGLSADLWRTDPVLGTSISRQRYQGAATPERSMSSANWPSILQTHELKGEATDNLFRDVGKRPRDPLPGEADMDGENSSDTSVRHQHTHHHYYHYTTPTSTTQRAKPKSSSIGRNPPRHQNGTSSEDRASLQKEKTNIKGDVLSNETEDRRLELRGKGATSTKDTEHIRMRSVQTSISGLDSKTTSKADAGNLVTELRQSNWKDADSERSSVSELNELLNAKKELYGRETSSSDALRKLNDKLERVRSEVKALEMTRVISSDASREGKDPHKIDENFGQSLPENRILPDNDSICSDSEFDYYRVGRRSPVYTEDSGESLWRNKQNSSKQPPLKDLLDCECGRSATQRRTKKKVQFKDFISQSRDERLEMLIESLKKEEKENKKKIDTVKTKYSTDLMNTQRRFEVKQKDSGKRDWLPKKTPHSAASSRADSRLAKVYGQRSRPLQRQVSKQRKRSASCSPIPRTRRKGRIVVDEKDIIPLMEEEFPQLYLSPVTAKMMWQKQMRQISNLTKAARPRKPEMVEQRIEESKKKQEALMNIMRKEVEHNKRLKDAKQKAHEQRQVKNKLRERRLASARARRYYDDYQLRMRSRQLKRKTKEEKIFKKLFEDALEIQKERIRELRNYAREQRALDAQRKQNELESIDNFYRDRFAMMAESIARERYEIEVREKAQRKVIDTVKKGIRQRMEKDLKDLQEQLVRDEDSAYFRQLDADALRKELQLATYKDHSSLEKIQLVHVTHLTYSPNLFSNDPYNSD